MISYYTAIVTATWQCCSLLEVFSLLFFCTDPPERRIKYGPIRKTNNTAPADPDSPSAWLLLRRTKEKALNGAPWAWALSHLPCSQSSAVSLQTGFFFFFFKWKPTVYEEEMKWQFPSMPGNQYKLLSGSSFQRVTATLLQSQEWQSSGAWLTTVSSWQDIFNLKLTAVGFKLSWDLIYC